ncbi:hypothetical protein DFH07DRAFT_765491 [Mycena maculata]|uniref:F-box domain-containing protein n=1 Tax=Mycena maculata TaxID=230809 RepID=A0AAD7K867_9AGAR|nr:hypothetical protein DFH07DRAFT_765491 [Mycena maculata]
MALARRKQHSADENPSTRAEDGSEMAEVASETTLLGILPRQRHKERKRVKAPHTSKHYPFRTLPTEIVVEIFTHFPPAYPFRPPATGILSPAVLSQICHEWREIALSIPTLWRAISLSLNSDSSSDKKRKTQLLLLETWLDRSRSCSLSIALIDKSFWNVQESLVEPFLQAIVAHCNRWEYLDLQVPLELSSLLKGDMPLLRGLQLGFTKGTGITPSDPVPVFQETPQLREANLGSINPDEITLPWTQFTRLTTQFLPGSSCWDMVEMMDNLVYCKLCSLGASRPRHIHLMQLETLIIRDEVPSSPDGFIDSWILPSLRELQIPEDYLRPDPVHTLVDFVSRSGCSLEDVCITGRDSPVSADTYRRALPSIPTLVTSPHYQGEYDEDDPERWGNPAGGTGSNIGSNLNKGSNEDEEEFDGEYFNGEESGVGREGEGNDTGYGG